MPFKRGPFQGMRTVLPCYVKFSDSMVTTPYDTAEFGPLVSLLCCQLTPIVCTVTIMPEFTPNTVMLEKHADKGKEPWEIFAWCVRDAISKYSGIPKDESSIKDKFSYINFV